jgi:hypothetical protein
MEGKGEKTKKLTAALFVCMHVNQPVTESLFMMTHKQACIELPNSNHGHR